MTVLASLKTAYLSKNCSGYFWKKIDYFLFLTSADNVFKYCLEPMS